MLPRAGERGGDLPHARILRAQMASISGSSFAFPRRSASRSGCRRRRDGVGARRRIGKRPGITGLHRRDGVGGAQQRGFREFAGMRIAGRLAGHGAQAESLVGLVVGRLQPAIVEHQRLALALLEIELAVVGAVDRLRHDRLTRAIEQVGQGFGHRHRLFFGELESPQFRGCIKANPVRRQPNSKFSGGGTPDAKDQPRSRICGAVSGKIKSAVSQ